MDNYATIELLRKEIMTTLSPIIGEQVILLDCPYHINIGDILIWQGELDFLKSIGRFPIAQSSLFTFTFPKLENNVTICLHGGGNFGDLYRSAQDFRKKVIETYPNNPIVMFPQSVWYEDKSLIEDDVKIFSKHSNVVLCARDKESFLFLNNNFLNNKILLVPDMAFYCDCNIFKDCIRSIPSGISVLIKRLDKEYVDNFEITEKIDSIRDWPTFEKSPFAFKLISKFARIMMKFPKSRIIFGKPIDFLMYKYLRCNLINKGKHLLSQFEKIYTTRLHAMILGIILNKEVIAIDNISHKLSDFYSTWLSENLSVKLYRGLI